MVGETEKGQGTGITYIHPCIDRLGTWMERERERERKPARE